MSTGKAKYFTSLLYPESIPENWEMESELMNIPMAIGPLYDKDKNSVEGQGYKKAHHHIIYVAANPVTTHSVRKRIQRALGNRSIAEVRVVKQSMENMYLYLTREGKDAIAKNKYKYAKKNIRLLSDFGIDRYVMPDAGDKEEMSDDACDMIDDHGLASIKELKRFVKEHRSDYDLPSMKIINGVLRSYTGLIELYFDVVCQERKYGRSYVNTHTGEIKKWFWIFGRIKFRTRKWL